MLRRIATDNSREKAYPYNIFPQGLDLKIINPLTFFVGENGTGKSTILESLALKTNLPTIGSSSTNQDQSLSHLKDFATDLKLSWDIVTHKGFFLRAEDFFGFTKYLHHLEVELKELKEHYNQNFTGYGKDLAVATIQGQINNIVSRYGDLNALSHGQGFLKLFKQRLVPGGLYLLDEPEAALSPTRQLSLISLIKNMLSQNCQFIIATHSPILLSFQPGQYFNFQNGQVRETKQSQIEHISLTKSILQSPESFFSKL